MASQPTPSNANAMYRQTATHEPRALCGLVVHELISVSVNCRDDKRASNEKRYAVTALALSSGAAAGARWTMEL